MAEEKTDPKRQIISKIKSSENILIALNGSPSVDDLTSALGLALAINQLNKRAAAIFSGKIPDALKFLEPDKTFEDSTDSLRDFIIALNKDKADHLRYKIEGEFVKVYITPYRTTINEKDLEFSQGDYNIDLIIALNVKSNSDLDEALSAHGKILHGAPVLSMTTDPSLNFGDTVWTKDDASSLSEMIFSLIKDFKSDKQKDPPIDKAVATALLTGIVAETDRFSNEKTRPTTMSLASELMAFGADQQLIAINLEKLNKSGDEEDSDGKLDVSDKSDTEDSDEPLSGAQDLSKLSINHGDDADDLDEKLNEVGSKVVEAKQEEAARLAEQRLAESLDKSNKPKDDDVLEDLKKQTEELVGGQLGDDDSNNLTDTPNNLVPPLPDITSDAAADENLNFPTGSVLEPPKYLAPETPPGGNELQGAVSSDSLKNIGINVGASSGEPTIQTFDSAPVEQSGNRQHAVVNPLPREEPVAQPVSPINDIPNIPDVNTDMNLGVDLAPQPTVGELPVVQTPVEEPVAVDQFATMPVEQQPVVQEDIQIPAPPPVPEFSADNGLPMPPAMPDFSEMPPVEPVVEFTSPPAVDVGSIPSNQPVMQDQVYPLTAPSEDPSQFKIPGM